MAGTAGLLGLVLFVGCGSATPQDAASGTERTYPPATTLASSVPLASVALTTPEQRRPAVLEPGEAWCPKSTATRTTPTTAAQPVAPTADLTVEHNIGVVNAYSDEHVDESGTPWLDHSTTPSRAVIGFTAHVAEHRAALNALAADPGRLLVCQIRHSAAEVSTTAAQIQALLSSSDVVRGITVGADDTVNIQLRADQQPLADELIARYGDLIAIRLGQLAYPDPASDTSPPSCPTLPDGPTDSHGLRATLSPPGQIASGADGRGTVTITNTGNAPQQLQTGSPLVAMLTRPGSPEVVGVYDAPVAGVGFGPTVAPGESVTVAYLVGTSSCDPSLGNALPPGTYDIHVEVLTDYQTNPPTPLLTSSPQQIEIAAP
jgi:hypothetical protein